MKKWIENCSLVVLIIIMVLLSGCIDHADSSKPVNTPTPQIVYVTVLVTPTSASTSIPTLTPTLTPTPLITLSQFCKELVTKNDEEFIIFLDDNNIESRIEALALHGCDILEAGRINQLIISNKTPDNSNLVNARKYLISSTTYCQAPNEKHPENDQKKTTEDLDQFSVNLNKYTNDVNGCNAEIDNIVAAQNFGNGVTVVPTVTTYRITTKKVPSTVLLSEIHENGQIPARIQFTAINPGKVAITVMLASGGTVTLKSPTNGDTVLLSGPYGTHIMRNTNYVNIDSPGTYSVEFSVYSGDQWMLDVINA